MKIDPILKEELKKIYLNKINLEKEAVSILAPVELNNEEKELIFSKFTGLRASPKLSFKKDSSLIAGILIKIGSKIIDLSLKGQLSNLRNKLYENT